MLQRTLIFFCSLMLCQIATAQVCYDYPCVIAKIKAAIDKADYNTAFDNLESASKYPKSSPEEISQLRKMLFDRINQEKIKAQEEETRSRRLLQQVRTESQRAESAEANVDRLAQEKAEQERSEKLRLENAKIVAHNRELANSVKDIDPTLALNILKYNLDNFPTDEPSRAAYNTLSQKTQNEIAGKAVYFRLLGEEYFLFDDNYHYAGSKSVAISKNASRCFLGFDDRIVFWDPISDTSSIIAKDQIIGEIKVDSSGKKLAYLNEIGNLIYLDLAQKRNYVLDNDSFSKAIAPPGISNPLSEANPYRAVNPFRADNSSNEEDQNTTRRSNYATRHDITTFDMAADGTFCIIGTEDGSVFKWLPIQDKFLQYFSGHKNAVSSISIAESSPFVLTGGVDGVARLWRTDAVTRTIQAYLGHRDSIYDLAISPDRTMCITLSKDKTMKWWEVETGREIRSFSVETSKGFGGNLPIKIQFSSDNRHFLLFNNDDYDFLNSTLIWDLDGESKGYQEIKYPYAMAENAILSIGQDGRPRLFQVHQLGHCGSGTCEGYTLTDSELELNGLLFKIESVVEIELIDRK